jgi:hypothetical protein
MLAFGQNDSSPQIYINQGELFYYGKEAEVKFGFSENDRKKIWDDIVTVENKSYSEAQTRYPLPPSSVEEYNKHLESYWVEQINKGTKLKDELYDKYKQELVQKYKITKDNIREIEKEGIIKGWASPVE